MDEQADMEQRLPYDPWWLNLREVLYAVADRTYDKPLEELAIRY